MNEIKRWEFHIAPIGLGECNCEDRENSNGPYVLYSDHKQALAQKEAECAELKEQIKKDHDDCTRCNDTDLHAENAELRERVKELQKIAIDGEWITKLKLKRESDLTLIDQLYDTIDALWETRERLHKENADLTRQLEEAQDTIKKLEEKIDGKQEVLDERLSLIQKLDVKILSLAEKLKDAEAQPEKTRKALEPVSEFLELCKKDPYLKLSHNSMWDVFQSVQAALAGKEK